MSDTKTTVLHGIPSLTREAVPVVELIWDERRESVLASDVRTMAEGLLLCAQEAEYDAHLLVFLTNEVGMSADDAVKFLTNIQAHRNKIRSEL